MVVLYTTHRSNRNACAQSASESTVTTAPYIIRSCDRVHLHPCVRVNTTRTCMGYIDITVCGHTFYILYKYNFVATFVSRTSGSSSSSFSRRPNYGARQQPQNHTRQRTFTLSYYSHYSSGGGVGRTILCCTILLMLLFVFLQLASIQQNAHVLETRVHRERGHCASPV